jgi:DNA-binding transcriptional LysR family regulator
MSGLDLKLIVIFDDLYKTRSVSQTAENLGLNQPAVSMSLARLRKLFNDPLFVKTPRGMEPTPHAVEVIHSLRQAHELIRHAMEHRDVFDPSTSTRVFRISGTDVGQVVILPRLMNHLREVAPDVLVDYSNFSTQTVKQLESGDVDLALGFIPPLNTGFHRQRLFAEHFECVARAGHPRIRKILTLDAFRQEFHLAVKTSGTGHQALDAALEAQGIRCRVGLRVPNYLGVATLIANTDLLVTVPSRLACVISSLVKVRVFPPPFAIEPYAVMQYWHARADKDAGNRWLRGVIAELFNDAPKARGGVSSAAASGGTPGHEIRNRTERRA